LPLVAFFAKKLRNKMPQPQRLAGLGQGELEGWRIWCYTCKYLTFQGKTSLTGFPFLNGKPFNSTLSSASQEKEFRVLRDTGQGSALTTRKLLKKLDQNFYCFSPQSPLSSY
jgi:hypothetical protein